MPDPGAGSLCAGVPGGRPEQPAVQPEVGSWPRKGGRARVVVGREDQPGMTEIQEPRSAVGLELRAVSNPREAACRAGQVPRART